MIDMRSGYNTYDLGHKIEVVKGKEYSTNQTYVMAQAESEEARERSRSRSRSSWSRSSSPSPPPRMKEMTTHRKRSSSSSIKSWAFTDPEMKRRKRVAKYKLYSAEGKVKSSVRRGCRWIKRKCSELVHGF